MLLPDRESFRLQSNIEACQPPQTRNREVLRNCYFRDGESSSYVEAVINAITLIAPPCITLCREDIAEANHQGDLTIDDLLTLIAAKGQRGSL